MTETAPSAAHPEDGEPLPRRLRTAAQRIRLDWSVGHLLADPQAPFHLSVADLLDRQADEAEAFLVSLATQPHVGAGHAPSQAEALAADRFAEAIQIAHAYVTLGGHAGAV